jgi:hypothetical protein
MVFTVTHINGAMEQGDEDILPRLLGELTLADGEHTDVSVQHESGWVLSVFPDRIVILENVESAESPRSVRLGTDGECLQVMAIVASGRIGELHNFPWQ